MKVIDYLTGNQMLKTIISIFTVLCFFISNANAYEEYANQDVFLQGNHPKVIILDDVTMAFNYDEQSKKIYMALTKAYSLDANEPKKDITVLYMVDNIFEYIEIPFGKLINMKVHKAIENDDLVVRLKLNSLIEGQQLKKLEMI